MSHPINEVPPVQIKTLDGRFIVMKQDVDRHGRPIIVVDIFSVNMERQSTVKLGFKDIPILRTALGTFAEAMLETMCDY